MRIGYQGVEGSNAEAAAKKLAERLSFKDAEFIPLISSKNVITALKQHRIDYGVVATKNTLGGTVRETFNAIKNEYL